MQVLTVLCLHCWLCSLLYSTVYVQDMFEMQRIYVSSKQSMYEAIVGLNVTPLYCRKPSPGTLHTPILKMKSSGKILGQTLQILYTAQ
jgi:hypothetical protein